jgi:hypothetical protein
VPFTEQELISEFDRRGIALNKRVLTDWRAKGYLPALLSKGSGRGKGKQYFWPDTAVLERALLVDEILDSDHRGPKILLILWLFQYDISWIQIREHLLATVVKIERVTGGTNSQEPSDVADHVDDAVVRYYELAAKYPQFGLRRDLPPEAMEMVLNIFLNATYNLNGAEFEEGVEASLKAETRPSVYVSESERHRSAKQMWTFVHEHFSLPHVKAAIVAAKEHDLHQAQADVGTIFRLIARMARDHEELANLQPMRVWAAYTLGTLMSIVDIALRHQGFGSFVDQGLTRVRDA